MQQESFTVWATQTGADMVKYTNQRRSTYVYGVSRFLCKL